MKPLQHQNQKQNQKQQKQHNQKRSYSQHQSQSQSQQYQNKKHKPSHTTTTTNIQHSKKELKHIRKSQKNPKTYPLLQQLKPHLLQLHNHTPSQQKHQLTKEIYQLIKGRIKELIYKHDSSRIVQKLLINGSQEVRELVVKELMGEYGTMSKSVYAVFLVMKALKYAPSKQFRDSIIDEVIKDVRLLVKDKYGISVIEEIWCLYSNAKQRSKMLEQYYGAEYHLSKQVFITTGTTTTSTNSTTQSNSTTSTDLKTILNHFPDRKERILNQYLENILPLLSTNSTTKVNLLSKSEFLHKLLLDLFLYLPLSKIQSLLQNELNHLLSEIPSFCHTKPGSQLGCLIISAVGAKERKSVVKGCREFVGEMLSDLSGWRVLAALVVCMDDSVQSSKLVGSVFDSSNMKKVLDSAGMTGGVSRFLMFLWGGSTQSGQSKEGKGSDSSGQSILPRPEFLVETCKKDTNQKMREVSSVVDQKIKDFFLTSITTDTTTTNNSNNKEIAFKCLLQWFGNIDCFKCLETVFGMSGEISQFFFEELRKVPFKFDGQGATGGQGGVTGQTASQGVGGSVTVTGGVTGGEGVTGTAGEGESNSSSDSNASSEEKEYEDFNVDELSPIPNDITPTTEMTTPTTVTDNNTSSTVINPLYNETNIQQHNSNQQIRHPLLNHHCTRNIRKLLTSSTTTSESTTSGVTYFKKYFLEYIIDEIHILKSVFHRLSTTSDGDGGLEKGQDGVIYILIALFKHYNDYNKDTGSTSGEEKDMVEELKEKVRVLLEEYEFPDCAVVVQKLKGVIN